MADLLEANFIFSFKPNPADLAKQVIDERAIRKKLRQILEVTRDCRVEIIMKDNHTLGFNPQNAVSWVRIAKEEAERAGER